MNYYASECNNWDEEEGYWNTDDGGPDGEWLYGMKIGGRAIVKAGETTVYDYLRYWLYSDGVIQNLVFEVNESEYFAFAKDEKVATRATKSVPIDELWEALRSYKREDNEYDWLFERKIYRVELRLDENIILEFKVWDEDEDEKE